MYTQYRSYSNDYSPYSTYSSYRGYGTNNPPYPSNASLRSRTLDIQQKQEQFLTYGRRYDASYDDYTQEIYNVKSEIERTDKSERQLYELRRERAIHRGHHHTGRLTKATKEYYQEKPPNALKEIETIRERAKASVRQMSLHAETERIIKQNLRFQSSQNQRKKEKEEIANRLQNESKEAEQQKQRLQSQRQQRLKLNEDVETNTKTTITTAYTTASTRRIRSRPPVEGEESSFTLPIPSSERDDIHSSTADAPSPPAMLGETAADRDVPTDTPPSMGIDEQLTMTTTTTTVTDTTADEPSIITTPGQEQAVVDSTAADVVIATATTVTTHEEPSAPDESQSPLETNETATTNDEPSSPLLLLPSYGEPPIEETKSTDVEKTPAVCELDLSTPEPIEVLPTTPTTTETAIIATIELTIEPSPTFMVSDITDFPLVTQPLAFTIPTDSEQQPSTEALTIPVTTDSEPPPPATNEPTESTTITATDATTTDEAPKIVAVTEESKVEEILISTFGKDAPIPELKINFSVEEVKDKKTDKTTGFILTPRSGSDGGGTGGGGKDGDKSSNATAIVVEASPEKIKTKLVSESEETVADDVVQEIVNTGILNTGNAANVTNIRQKFLVHEVKDQKNRTTGFAITPRSQKHLSGVVSGNSQIFGRMVAKGPSVEKPNFPNFEQRGRHASDVSNRPTRTNSTDITPFGKRLHYNSNIGPGGGNLSSSGGGGGGGGASGSGGNLSSSGAGGASKFQNVKNVSIPSIALSHDDSDDSDDEHITELEVKDDDLHEFLSKSLSPTGVGNKDSETTDISNVEEARKLFKFETIKDERNITMGYAVTPRKGGDTPALIIETVVAGTGADADSAAAGAGAGDQEKQQEQQKVVSKFLQTQMGSFLGNDVKKRFNVAEVKPSGGTSPGGSGAGVLGRSSSVGNPWMGAGRGGFQRGSAAAAAAARSGGTAPGFVLTPVASNTTPDGKEKVLKSPRKQ